MAMDAAFFPARPVRPLRCVAFRIIGQAVVDDVGEVVDVQTACGNVGSHQQLQVAYAEFLHDGIALRRLAQFTVQRVGIVTFLHQFVGNFLSFLAGTAEDDAVYLRIVIYDAFQGRRTYLWHER